MKINTCEKGEEQVTGTNNAVHNEINCIVNKHEKLLCIKDMWIKRLRTMTPASSSGKCLWPSWTSESTDHSGELICPILCLTSLVDEQTEEEFE
jgi:D-hexose-6-phosphate mutarotase